MEKTRTEDLKVTKQRIPFLSTLLLLLMVIGQVVEARVLNPREQLARCYTHLTGLRLSATDPLYAKLAKQSAAKICIDILAEVKFGADGMLTARDNPLHRAVLKQFNDMHRGWFDKRMLLANELNDALSGTIDVIDPYQQSYYITRAFFTDGLHYNSVLRGYDNIMAVRDVSKATTAGSASGTRRPTRLYFGGYDGEGSDVSISPTRMVESVLAFAPTPDINKLSFAAVPMVQVGELIGIRNEAGQANIGGFWTKATAGGGSLNDAGLRVPLNPDEAFGGGALGTQSALVLNFGHSFDYDTNGTTKLPRRWIDTEMKSFMCRQGPYVRASDITPYKRAEAEAPPFRQSDSCLRCHAMMDQAAMTTRNLVIGQTSTFINSHNRLSALIGRFNVSAGNEAGQEFWPWKPVASFKYQAPVGKLYLRSINGTLIDQPVNNLNELGIALSNTDDYYACAAKRYFEKFTGVAINLYDPNDVDNTSVIEGQNERDIEFRRFVLALGQELKAGGSLKNMVKRILESDYYKQSDFGK
jgi:hypothetical protein